MTIYVVLMHQSEETKVCATFKKEKNAALYVETQNKLCGHYYTYAYEAWHLLDTDYD